jgi:putative peptidoglycan lipid II flippase
VLGRPLAVTLFEWGNYEHSSALATGPVIAMAGLALVPYAIGQLQTFVFYALSDTRWPALVNIPVVALRVGVDVLFLVVMPAAWIAAALMGGSAISFVVAAGLWFWLLRRRIGRLGMSQVAGTLARLIAAATVGGVAAWAVVAVLTGLAGDGKAASMLQLVLGGATLIAGFAAAAIGLRVAEVRQVAAMVGGRLRRG